MYDLDLVKVNKGLVKALRVTLAARGVIGKGNAGYIALDEIQREIREAAAECQRVLGLIELDEKRELLSGKGG